MPTTQLRPACPHESHFEINHKQRTIRCLDCGQFIPHFRAVQILLENEIEHRRRPAPRKTA